MPSKHHRHRHHHHRHRKDHKQSKHSSSRREKEPESAPEAASSERAEHATDLEQARPWSEWFAQDNGRWFYRARISVDGSRWEHQVVEGNPHAYAGDRRYSFSTSPYDPHAAIPIPSFPTAVQSVTTEMATLNLAGLGYPEMGAVQEPFQPAVGSGSAAQEMSDYAESSATASSTVSASTSSTTSTTHLEERPRVATTVTKKLKPTNKHTKGKAKSSHSHSHSNSHHKGGKLKVNVLNENKLRISSGKKVKIWLEAIDEDEDDEN